MFAVVVSATAREWQSGNAVTGVLPPHCINGMVEAVLVHIQRQQNMCLFQGY